MAEGPALPHPRRTPHDPQRRTPQRTAPDHEWDAVRTTPAHADQPAETTQGKEGAPTWGEKAAPTEEAARNTTAQPTTTPSQPGDDPGEREGHLTGTGRGRRCGHSTQG